MEILRILGIGIIALVFSIILKQYRPEFSVYISLLAGVLILVIAMEKVSGIIQILMNLSNRTSINKDFLVIILKITGIAILTEYITSICKDAGESAIASKVDFGGKAMMMSLSIPIINGLLQTIANILPS